MKRLIAAGILFIFVISSYIIGYSYIKTTCNKAYEILDECTEVYSAHEESEEIAKRLNDFWGEKEPYLSLFANHAQIDQIEQAISSLLIYSNSKDSALFYEYSSTVNTLLHQMLEDNTPSMHSIF